VTDLITAVVECKEKHQRIYVQFESGKIIEMDDCYKDRLLEPAPELTGISYRVVVPALTHGMVW